MIRSKVHTGPGAAGRRRAELDAHEHEAAFWTSRVERWGHGSLVDERPPGAALSFQWVDGEVLTWADVDELVAAVASAIAAIAASGDWGTWVHGDLHPGNVIRSGDDLVLVDWELARPGRIVEDAGSLLAHAALRDLRDGGSPRLVLCVIDGIAGQVSPDALLELGRLDLLRQRDREAGIGDDERVRERDRALVLLGSAAR